jgi:hypothetical protein
MVRESCDWAGTGGSTGMKQNRISGDDEALFELLENGDLVKMHSRDRYSLCQNFSGD